MIGNLTDEQLVETAIKDNPEAFGEISKKMGAQDIRFCFGMLSREEDARDAAQETFISAYRNLAKFRGDAKVSSWLHRIAVNQCLSKQRYSKVRKESYLEDENGEVESRFAAPSYLVPSHMAEKKERLTLVRQAVSSLPEDLRMVIVLKEFNEMTFQEISDSLEIPLSTVKSRVYTALKQLRLKLEKTPIEMV